MHAQFNMHFWRKNKISLLTAAIYPVGAIRAWNRARRPAGPVYVHRVVTLQNTHFLNIH